MGGPTRGDRHAFIWHRRPLSKLHRDGDRLRHRLLRECERRTSERDGQRDNDAKSQDLYYFIHTMAIDKG